MTTGRTVPKWERVYVNGFDVSGYARSMGPFTWQYAEVDQTALNNAVMGYLPGQPQISPGTISSVFDNTATSGMHAVASTQGGNIATLLAPVGIQAVPALGDPAFMGQFFLKEYTAKLDAAGGVYVSMPFSGWYASSTTLPYDIPWGNLIHPWGAETSTSTQGGYYGSTVATTYGGFAVFQMNSSTAGGVPLKIQSSPDNTTWSDLVTSATMDASSAPQSSVVALSRTASVDKYLRATLGAACAGGCTFAAGFVRAFH